MINNNKILTVSYGTFSCTLEGFDDSFGTMKAIAEYFRDLSADDRYFGAEPAQPDAQMLARIAQREISRHVEAREDRGRIVLSAQNVPKTAAALVATDAVDDVAEAIADAAVAKSTERESEKPTQMDESGDEQQTTAPEANIVEETAASVSDEAAKPANVATEDETAPADEAQSVSAQAEPVEHDIVPSLPDEEVEAFFADSAHTDATDYTVEDYIDNTPAEDRAKADSIADKLKRIRAVVSQHDEEEAAPEYSEDEHADAAAVPAAMFTDAIADEDTFDDEDEYDAPQGVLADTLRDLEDALDADDETEAVDDTFDHDHSDDIENEDDDIAAILSRLDNEAGASDDVDEYDSEDDDDYLADDDDMGGNILAAMDGLDVGAYPDDSEPTDDNLFGDGNIAEAVDHEDFADAEEPQPVPTAPRARVLKVKRATLEAAIKSGQLEEYEEEDAEPSESVKKALPTARSSLSDEEEDALARELAELEADMDADDSTEQSIPQNDAHDGEFDDDFADEAEVAEPDAAPQPAIRASADDDFSRLMEESEQQMDEPEAATRRDAFAHLRAAVAAKKADEAVGGTDEHEETDEAYRIDLASVVRPRRPVSGERVRTERPAEARPAPLKLVAEQRIDVSHTNSVVPVRPRRVAAVEQQATQNPTPTADGFANFADEMGATKLPDLLEAAAAYLSFVEGHEQFSRPQLMTKVRQVEKENFTREDSLRSFGKLLREGKIEKMKGGRFQASDQIGFNPAKRAAG